MLLSLVVIAIIALVDTPARAAMKVTFSGNQEAPQIAFAAAEIRKAAEAPQEAAPLTVEFAFDSARLKPQGYRLEQARGERFA